MAVLRNGCSGAKFGERGLVESAGEGAGGARAEAVLTDLARSPGRAFVWCVLVERLNPHPSSTEVMRHPEIQLRSFGWCGRVCHPPE